MLPEKNMGDLFREAFNDFERKPSDKVWDNIENSVSHPSFQKVNYFKTSNVIIGSAVLIMLSVIMFYLLSEKQIKKTTPKTITHLSTQINKTDEILSKTANIIIPTKITNNTKQTAITTQQNSSTAKVSKKTNIQDLIAEVNKDEENLVNYAKQNVGESLSILKSNTTNSNQKLIDSQQISKNNTIPSKAIPISTISFSADQTICKGEKTKLSVNGGVSYLWSTGEKQQYIIVSPSISTDYSVIATDEVGNRKTGLISVIVSNCNAPFIPNAFSPNGDGQSDVFKVYANEISKYEIIIISRSGQIVYSSKNVNEAWDGNIKGKPAPAEVYIYTVKYTNELNKEQIITGHVTLIR